MALHKLVFDATDADSRLASANVGAYLRASDGTLLTHTDVGGLKALDVNVANEIAVDLDFATDSVDVSGSDVTVSNTVAVSATDLDIRDLAFATDSVDVTGSSVGITGDVNVTQGTSPWVVSSTDLDIRDLAFATDKVDASGSTVAATQSGAWTVTANQGTSPWVVSDPTLADAAIKTVAETVGIAAAQIVDGADELAGRKYLAVYNNGSKQAYIGAAGVTTATGFPVPPGSILETRIGAAVDVYMIADAAAQNVRTLQLS
jgi:hypothetical protein